MPLPDEFIGLLIALLMLPVAILTHRFGHWIAGRLIGLSINPSLYDPKMAKSVIRMIELRKFSKWAQVLYWTGGSIANVIGALPVLCLAMMIASAVTGGREFQDALLAAPRLIFTTPAFEMYGEFAQIAQMPREYGALGYVGWGMLQIMTYTVYCLTIVFLQLVPLPPFDLGRILFATAGVSWQKELRVAQIVGIFSLILVALWLFWPI